MLMMSWGAAIYTIFVKETHTTVPLCSQVDKAIRRLDLGKRQKMARIVYKSYLKPGTIHTRRKLETLAGNWVHVFR